MSASEKGLSLHVYRSADGYDCTLGGASSKVSSFTVVGVVRKRWNGIGNKADLIEPMPEDSQIFPPSEKQPAAILEVSALADAHPHLVPLDVYLDGKWFMSGGNLADSSDGRMTKLIRSFLPKDVNGRRAHPGAIMIMDRVEEGR